MTLSRSSSASVILLISASFRNSLLVWALALPLISGDSSFSGVGLRRRFTVDRFVDLLRVSGGEIGGAAGACGGLRPLWSLSVGEARLIASRGDLGVFGVLWSMILGLTYFW